LSILNRSNLPLDARELGGHCRGTVTAIILTVNQMTVTLALLSVAAHLAFIFWPRKPLGVPTDEEGRPILWRNDEEQKENVACVWNESPAERPAVLPVGAKSAASASESITERNAGERGVRRSAA
jgi:hypothetical protein